MFKKNLAFTLAETLIVIAIIGVVAALTLPNLNSSTADKETVTKVKKIYAGLTDAYDRAQATYGTIDGWFNDLATEAEMSKRAKDRITEFMKVSKDCGNSNVGCWYSDDTDKAYVNLADGMSISMYGVVHSVAEAITIEVDINGPNKGKNEFGKDIFNFEIINTTEVGYPSNQLQPDYEPRAWTGTTLPEDYPTAWIIKNGNMDYLKADCSSYSECVCPDGESLNWETKTSCN